MFHIVMENNPSTFNLHILFQVWKIFFQLQPGAFRSPWGPGLRGWGAMIRWGREPSLQQFPREQQVCSQRKLRLDLQSGSYYMFLPHPGAQKLQLTLGLGPRGIEWRETPAVDLAFRSHGAACRGGFSYQANWGKGDRVQVSTWRQQTNTHRSSSLRAVRKARIKSLAEGQRNKVSGWLMCAGDKV